MMKAYLSWLADLYTAIVFSHEIIVYNILDRWHTTLLPDLCKIV